jgi:hypothetical protein
VVCGNITGQISYPIRVSILNHTAIDNNVSLGMDNSDTSRVYIISISVLATALIVGAVASITVIITVIIRSKVKIKAGHALQLTNPAEKNRDTDSMYEDVTGHFASASAINTQQNVSYGHTHQKQN